MPNIEIPRDVALTIPGFFAYFLRESEGSPDQLPGLSIRAGSYRPYSGGGFEVLGGRWTPGFAVRVLDVDLGTPSQARGRLFQEAGQTAPPLASADADADEGGESVPVADEGGPLSFPDDRGVDQHLLYRHEETVHDVQVRKDGYYCLARVPHASAGVEGDAPAGAMYDVLFALPREGTTVTPVKLHVARVADSGQPFHHFNFFHAADGYAGPERIHLAEASGG